MRCKRFYEQAFDAQGKCYAEMGDRFCKVFPENKNQFMKTMERDDYMNTYFISMVKNTLGKCKPPIDLFSLMFSWFSCFCSETWYKIFAHFPVYEPAY